MLLTQGNNMTELKYIEVNILEEIDGMPIIEVIQFLTEFISENLTDADQIENTSINLGASEYIPEITINYTRLKTSKDIEDERESQRRRNRGELARAEKHYLRLKVESERLKT